MNSFLIKLHANLPACFVAGVFIKFFKLLPNYLFVEHPWMKNCLVQQVKTAVLQNFCFVNFVKWVRF